MLRLLIVEDDLTIREGLATCINWKDYGIDFVSQAVNGKKALQFIEDNPVDIIITDVAMPQMDGIELVKKVREKGLDIKVAFISGHSDLQLLKAAFKLDAVDYILKPVRREELDTVLAKITGLCFQEKRQKESLYELKRKLEESMPVLKERFISTLLKKYIPDNEYIENRIKFLGLPFKNDLKYTVMAFDISSSNKDRNPESFEKREIELLLGFDGIFTDISENINSQYIVEDDNTILLIIFTPESLGYDQAIDVAKKVQQIHYTHTGCLPAAGIGKEVASPGMLYNSYNQCKRALEQKYFLGQDAIIHINDIERSGNNITPDLSDLKKSIIDVVKFGKVSETETLVDELFKLIKNMQPVSMNYVRNMCMELAVLAEREYLELKISDRKSENEGVLWDILSRCNSLENTHKCLRKKLLETAYIIQSVKANTSGNLTFMMQKYIRENYSEDITIHTLANEFYITSNYVCMLFKKETGKTFNDYLTEVRMEKAMELLSNTLLKVYEVSEKVGYHDVDYFGKLFKKHTGLTITQFKGKKTFDANC